MEPFAVGFDLGREYSQICCWQGQEKEPVSLSVVSGAQKYRIQTEDLDSFLKKAMRLLKPYGKLHEAEAVTFCVDNAGEEEAGRIRRSAMQLMGVPESRIFVVSRQESFCDYVMSQPKEIWRHQAVLFVSREEQIHALSLQVSSRTVPAIVRTEEDSHFCTPISGLSPEEKDAAFAGLIRRVFEKRAVSSVFLVGEAFEEQWYTQSLRFLCADGRRVFAGNNLFAKGACYRAMQEARASQPRSYVFLDRDKIPCNVALRIAGTGKDAYYTLLEAGSSWYDAKAECEAFLLEDPVVEFILKPMQGEVILKESLYLEGLPQRPPRTTRLRIAVEFLQAGRLLVEVKDLGFGELFPSSDLSWSEEIDLTGEE